MKFLATLAVLGSVDGIFLKKLSPVGEAFNLAADACCACFNSKYKLPENGGFSPTFAVETTCGKCFVSDKYAKPAEEEVVKKDLPYEVIESKQEEVHEWNWNCGNGAAPEDAAAWSAGPVEGEPGARGAFEMCLEDPGFYCASSGAGPSLSKSAGDGEVKELSGEGEDESKKSDVKLMKLPEIGA